MLTWKWKETSSIRIGYIIGNCWPTTIHMYIYPSRSPQIQCLSVWLYGNTASLDHCTFLCLETLSVVLRDFTSRGSWASSLGRFCDASLAGVSVDAPATCFIRSSMALVGSTRPALASSSILARSSWGAGGRKTQYICCGDLGGQWNHTPDDIMINQHRSIYTYKEFVLSKKNK